jgi:hypothetical protein
MRRRARHNADGEHDNDKWMCDLRTGHTLRTQKWCLIPAMGRARDKGFFKLHYTNAQVEQ